MGLKLRAPYILLAISLVVLAIGIILIVIDSTPDRTTETPGITTLVPQTLVVPEGESRKLYFDISGSGVLRGTVEVIGGSIYYGLYKEPSGKTVDEYVVSGSNFEALLDTGRYYLEVSVMDCDSYPSWINCEDGIVNVYLDFES